MRAGWDPDRERERGFTEANIGEVSNGRVGTDKGQVRHSWALQFWKGQEKKSLILPSAAPGHSYSDSISQKTLCFCALQRDFGCYNWYREKTFNPVRSSGRPS